MAILVTAAVAVIGTLIAVRILHSVIVFSVSATGVPAVTLGPPHTKEVTVFQTLTITLGSQVDHLVCFLYPDTTSAAASMPTDPNGITMMKTGTNTWSVTRMDAYTTAPPHYAVVWGYWYNPIVPRPIVFKLLSGPSAGFTPP